MGGSIPHLEVPYHPCHQPKPPKLRQNHLPQQKISCYPQPCHCPSPQTQSQNHHPHLEIPNHHHRPNLPTHRARITSQINKFHITPSPITAPIHLLTEPESPPTSDNSWVSLVGGMSGNSIDKPDKCPSTDLRRWRLRLPRGRDRTQPRSFHRF